MPAVSAIVPVRNEVATIERSIRSVLDQDYPALVDVVVADGMSADGTRAIVESLAAIDPRVRLVDNPTGATPAALNAAVRAARGEVIVRCDAHSFLPPGYVRHAVEIMRRTGADNVGGMQLASGRTPVQRAIALAMHIPLGVGDARFHLGGDPGPVDTVYLGVFRRAALERVGLFDEHLLRNQDADLNYRLRATGGLVYFHPDLKVDYVPRDSLRALWRQYWGSGAWKRETFRRRPGAVRWRQVAPPALVLGLAASAVLAFSPWRALALVVPALYALALAGTAAWTALRRRDPTALLLPIVLPSMHLAWGTGFLLGRAARRARGRTAARTGNHAS